MFEVGTRFLCSEVSITIDAKRNGRFVCFSPERSDSMCPVFRNTAVPVEIMSQQTKRSIPLETYDYINMIL